MWLAVMSTPFNTARETTAWDEFKIVILPDPEGDLDPPLEDTRVAKKSWDPAADNDPDC